MAKFPIDSGSYTSFTCTLAPKPAMNTKTNEQKKDRYTGELVFEVQLVAVGAEGGWVIPVKFPGTPHAGIKAGVPLRVTGLSVEQWEIATENKHGLAFRADKVEPLSLSQAPKAGAA